MWTRLTSWCSAALLAVVTMSAVATPSSARPMSATANDAIFTGTSTTESLAPAGTSFGEGAVRLSGPNRYATSAEVALSWPAGTQTVFVSSGESFPDALTAASRAGSEQAPLLLTRRADLPGETSRALARLSPQRIVVVGGTGEVSQAVARALEQYTPSGQVLRVGGDTAYATSLAVSRLYPAGVETAYLASGETFPDALAGAALSGHQGAPLLLTGKDGMDPSTRAELARLSPQQIVVVGGPAAVSADVLRSAEPLSRQPVRRVAGTDRYRTAAAVAAEFVRTPTSVTTYIAAGHNFPDALVGAAAAARDGAPVLLTPQATVHPATTGALKENPPRALYVLGGPSVIYSSTMTSLAEYVATPGSAERFTPLSDSADFDWSGQQWSAKDATSQGPGPNRWHRSGVELGDRGSMRLTVQKNSAGQWQSSEIARKGPTGYGTFAFTTTSSVLPPNEQSVLGLFSYQHLTPNEGYEEIDIEYSQWSKPGTGPGSVTVHKPTPPWHREFSLDYTGPMTHSFLWAPDYIAWQIVREDNGEVLYERELRGADVPKYVDARMRLNLWLIDGVPADQQEPFEVTFSSATWTPLPAGFVAPAAPTSPPVTADLQEAFDGPLQTSRWPGRFLYGSPQVSQGRLDVPLGPGFHGVRSESEYRLAGSSIAVEQIRPRSVHPNSESEVSFLHGEQNSIALITVGDETGRTRIRTGGVDRSVDFTYDRIAHRWLRIRQSGTRIYFEGSPDGLAWSAVVPSQISPTWVLDGSGQVKLGGGNYAMDDPAGSVYFDNLNRSG